MLTNKATQSLQTFNALVAFNMVGLEKIVNEVTAEEVEVASEPHVALGVVISHLIEHSEQNYTTFCHEFSSDLPMIKHPTTCPKSQNFIIQDNVGSTLSEIVNCLQLSFRAFSDHSDGSQDSEIADISELKGLRFILRSVSCAASVCLDSIQTFERSHLVS